MTCSVKGCNTFRRLLEENENISFHRFPKEPESLRHSWVVATGVDPTSFKWSKNKRICSKHFRHEDYYLPHRLKSNAVPSLCLPIDLKTTSYLHEDSLDSSVPSTSDVSTQKRSFPMSSPNSLQKRKKYRGILEKNLSSASSKSTDSSTKSRRGRLIKQFHNYSTSPEKLMKQNKVIRDKQVIYRKKLYDERYKNKKLKEKVTNLARVLFEVKKKEDMSHNAIHHLQTTYSDVPAMLMARHLKNVQNATVTHETYPAPLREFAATLNFYSPKAYNYVRQQFSLALPDCSTLRKWFTNVDCSPGFIDPVFDTLKIKSEESNKKGYDLICSLVVDEISIKTQIEFDGQKSWGYTDVGTSTKNDSLTPAKDVFVVMVVGLTGYWKVPIAYFYVAGLSGQEKASIILQSLERLYEVGVKITSVTSDGPLANFAMFRHLGCDFSDAFKLKTFFPHPSNGESVYAILDACHMLKLLRNHFEALLHDGSFLDPDGNKISWKYISLLHKFQEEEGLLFGCKIKKSHIDFKTQKMKVYLAAQVFSQSTADAIKFLAEDTKQAEFLNSGPTVAFISLINDMFDILNCRNPLRYGYKGALREKNVHLWRPLLRKAATFLLRCTDSHYRPLYMSEKKTPFLGFAVTISSICGIFDQYVTNKVLSYLLTYKFSQDHLETFFCAMRSRNGWNNNPTCLQFMRTIRRILLFSNISGKGGNCRLLDTTTVLTISSGNKCESKKENIIDIQLCRIYELEPSAVALEDHDYNINHAFIPLTDLSRNVVTYIAGFVLRMMTSRKSQCSQCLIECFGELTNDIDYRLLNRKDRGGLIVPSKAVRDICVTCEVGIRKVMALTDNKIPSEENFFQTFTFAMAQRFYKDTDELFPGLQEHFLETAMDVENHGFILIKNIIYNYTKIRFYNLAKKYSEKIQGKKIRHQLNKLILFNHQ